MIDKNISYLRIRPCDSDNEIYLNSRAKEGTSTFTLKSEIPVNYENLLIKGFQTVASDLSISSSAWFITDENVTSKITHNSKRLIYRYKGNKENELEIISRNKPSTILIEDISDIAFLQSINGATDFNISIYANSVDDAKESIENGIDDLFLRDWSKDQLFELQGKTEEPVYERTLLSPLFDVNEARSNLEKTEFTNYLQTRNVRGYKRETTKWYPGSGVPIPKLVNFSSESLSDYKTSNFEKILDNFDKTKTLSESDLLELFKTSGKYVNRVAEIADDLTRSVHGNKVTFVKNRNINYTNQCYYKCGFCGFSKGPQSLDLKEKPYTLTPEEVLQRTIEAHQTGASEVCLQGGIHPSYTGDFYIDLVKKIKDELPDMHIHGFTPLEIWQGASTVNKSVETYLTELKEAGLGTLPGTAAEILDDRIRKFLCDDKITSSQWGYVMEVAHSLGIKSTATIMFGHDGAKILLRSGVNDLGGTLINENISRASGANHGQETTDLEFINLIKDADKIPYLRNTLYTSFKNLEDVSSQNVIKI